MELDVELVPGVDKSQHYSPNCHSDAINSPSNSMIPSIELKLFDGAVCGQVDDTHTASSVVTGGGDLGALLANDRSVVHHQLNHSTEEDECAGSSTTTMWGCHHCGLAMNGTEQQLHDHISQCGLTQTVIHQGDDMEEEGAPHHLVTTAFDERAHHHDTLSTDHFTSTMLIAEDCDAAAAGLPPQPSVLCTEEDAGGGTHDVHTQQGDVSVGTKKSFVTSSDVRLVARYWKCSVCGVATQQGLASHLNSHSKDELIGALLALAEPVYHAADEVFLATSQTEATKSPEDDQDDVIPVFESSNNTITEYNNEQNGVSLTSCLETAPPQQHVVTISPPRHGKVSSDAWDKRTPRNVVREVDANDNNMHRELTLRGVQVVKEICNYSNSDHSTVSTKPNTPSKPVHKKFTIINHKHSNVASVGGFQRQQAGGDTGGPASTVGIAPTASGRGGRGRRRGAPSRASGVQRQWSSRAPHPCPVCGKVLSSRGNVAKHITTHSTSKPWNCPPCGIGFNSQRDKQHHDQQYHSGGERGYICSICGKAFAVRDTLREHLLFHDRKDKACDICGKMFWTQKCVTRHRKRHFPDKKHRCDMCPKTFAVKWDCTLHARKVHGVT